MAGANSNIQLADLDFTAIKNNLKTFLQSQDVLKDYNYDGAALSVLLDVLAYNTQYNAYYLNMVGNEMFLDSALLRNSVVSQAKVLNYIPKSVIAPTATINLTVNQVNTASLTLPKFTQFMSEAIEGINYSFVTADATTVNVSSNTATFTDISLKQGIPTSISYTVNTTTNPKFVFQIPETNVDTTTLEVLVQESSSNSSYKIYSKSTDVLALDSESLVYFLQEGNDGLYEVYFGDDILGKKLINGNIVRMNYIVSAGPDAAGANSFVLMNPIGGFSNTVTIPVSAATTGALKESIESIKFQAPKSYSAQKRAVTKEDYITAIQQNNLGYSFDAVNVWGGQENDPPVYGQVFVCIKPAGAYLLTQLQKQKIVSDILRPISVMTVDPAIVDPDYTYLQITANVLYDPKKTNLTANQLQSAIKNSISNLAASSLNTFNSTFKLSDFTNAINNLNQSILTNEINISVQKKFLPNLTNPQTYKFYFNIPLKRGMFQSGIGTLPALNFYDPVNRSIVIDGVYIEEVPSSTGGVESVSIINPGFGYQSTPTVKILGDGTGATATATINNNGTLKSIEITNIGSGYTSAIVQIIPATSDTTGQLGSAIAVLEGQFGTLRTYYFNSNNVKTILNNNAGSVDYINGIVTLNDFNPLNVDNPLGQLTLSANPTTTIISSSYNRIITVDPFDPNAIVVNVSAKT
jgi:hypothetical protein